MFSPIAFSRLILEIIIYEFVDELAYYAIKHNDPSAVKFILNNFNMKFVGWSSLGASPLEFASELGRAKIVRILVESNQCDINFGIGATPLDTACIHGHGHIVKILLLSGATVNPETVDFAKFCGTPEILKQLLLSSSDRSPISSP
jgi:ankyrin repeat protein